jgi:hypothetical protein
MTCAFCASTSIGYSCLESLGSSRRENLAWSQPKHLETICYAIVVWNSEALNDEAPIEGPKFTAAIANFDKASQLLKRICFFLQCKFKDCLGTASALAAKKRCNNNLTSIYQKQTPRGRHERLRTVLRKGRSVLFASLLQHSNCKTTSRLRLELRMARRWCLKQGKFTLRFLGNVSFPLFTSQRSAAITSFEFILYSVTNSIFPNFFLEVLAAERRFWHISLELNRRCLSVLTPRHGFLETSKKTQTESMRESACFKSLSRKTSCWFRLLYVLNVEDVSSC